MKLDKIGKTTARDLQVPLEHLVLSSDRYKPH